MNISTISCHFEKCDFLKWIGWVYTITIKYRRWYFHIKRNKYCNVFTMSGILMYPVENTIAFGGVATGSMNANEHATAAVIIKYNGWDPVLIAWRKRKNFFKSHNKNPIYTRKSAYHCKHCIITSSAMMGISMVAVALLLVISVAPAMTKDRIKFITQGSKLSRIRRLQPTFFDKPEA